MARSRRRPMVINNPPNPRERGEQFQTVGQYGGVLEKWRGMFRPDRVSELAKKKHHVGGQAFANVAANAGHLYQSAGETVWSFGVRQQAGDFQFKFSRSRAPVFRLGQFAVARLQA